MRLIQVFQSETRISYCWISYTWSLIFQLIKYIYTRRHILLPSCSQLHFMNFRKRSKRVKETRLDIFIFYSLLTLYSLLCSVSLLPHFLSSSLQTNTAEVWADDQNVCVRSCANLNVLNCSSDWASGLRCQHSREDTDRNTNKVYLLY